MVKKPTKLKTNKARVYHVANFPNREATRIFEADQDLFMEFDLNHVSYYMDQEEQDSCYGVLVLARNKDEATELGGILITYYKLIHPEGQTCQKDF